MSLKFFFLFAVVALFTIVGCNKNGSLAPNKTLQTGVDVYVVGYRYASNGHYVATLWKNGKPTRLADSLSNSIAYKIVVNGTNTYISGYTSDAKGIQIEQCWINGVTSSIHTGGTDIAVKGNDIFTVGQYNLGSGIWVPVYWKNGQLQILADLTGQGGAGNANAIAVDGNNVYVAGYYTLGNAAFWKNGLAVPIDTDPAGSEISTIYLQGNDIYLLGFLGLKVAYWKNGIATKLANTSTVADSVRSSVHGIAVSGQDLYIAGSVTSTDRRYDLENYDAAVYWKNGVITRLTTGLHGEANDITIQGNDIYVAGEDQPNNFYGGTATYWKNGAPVPLEKGIAYGIVVVPR